MWRYMIKFDYKICGSATVHFTVTACGEVYSPNSKSSPHLPLVQTYSLPITKREAAVVEDRFNPSPICGKNAESLNNSQCLHLQVADWDS